mmetsp:Transcript_43302/g.94328  ORF Transcript_43302/g.94328 Transcript_43302/m.94328 type:complete len:214 (-) Transcript_43302:1059-1700(-)
MRKWTMSIRHLCRVLMTTPRRGCALNAAKKRNMSTRWYSASNGRYQLMLDTMESATPCSSFPSRFRSAGTSSTCATTTSLNLLVSSVRFAFSAKGIRMTAQPQTMMKHWSAFHARKPPLINVLSMNDVRSFRNSTMVIMESMIMKRMSAMREMNEEYLSKNKDSSWILVNTLPPRLNQNMILTCSSRGLPTSALRSRAFTLMLFDCGSSHPLS